MAITSRKCANGLIYVCLQHHIHKGETILGELSLFQCVIIVEVFFNTCDNKNPMLIMQNKNLIKFNKFMRMECLECGPQEDCGTK